MAEEALTNERVHRGIKAVEDARVFLPHHHSGQNLNLARGQHGQ